LEFPLKRFNDSTGKQWEIDIHVGSIEKVKNLCGVDLTKIFEPDLKLLGQLFDDPKLLTDVLWCLCENGDKSTFVNAMRGDALEQAANALIEDVIDFFPNAKRRELCRLQLRKIWEITGAEQAKFEAAVNSLDLTSLHSATNLGVSSD